MLLRTQMLCFPAILLTVDISGCDCDCHHVVMPDKEDDMMQQLHEAGEELQDNEIDSVLERCEQLSHKLREALQTHGTDRSG